MFDKLKGIEERFYEIETLLSNPEIVQDQEAYQKYVREHAELNKVVSVLKKIQTDRCRYRREPRIVKRWRPGN